MAILPFLPESQGPPWLPASAADARKWAYWAVLVVFIFMVIGIIVAIAAAIFFPWMLISAVIMFVVGLIVILIAKSTVFDPLDQGRFKDASTFLLIWGIIGLIVSLIPGILFLVAFIKLQEVFSPQYQQYQAQPGYQGQPPAGAPQQQYQAPPPQQAPAPQAPAQPEQQGGAGQKVEMVKCAKCGVQYPAFMHHCPNCNTPR
jgi:hypothetical protein